MSEQAKAGGLCPRCGGLQYLTAQEADRAVATACSCVSGCERCGGTGLVSERDDQGYEFVKSCRCQSLSERIELYKAARLPGRYCRKTIENYKPQTESQKQLFYGLLHYRKNYRAGQRGILLSGRPGTGKTHLLTALVAHLTLERGYRARYIEFMTLLSELKDGYNQGRTESDIIGPVARVPILVVDELGKGRNTDWELSVLDELISRRYNGRLTTLFATNYPPTIAAAGTRLSREHFAESLEERVGARIFSRLVEMCDFHEVDGPDFRKQRR